jgi:hypothetical protein
LEAFPYPGFTLYRLAHFPLIALHVYKVAMSLRDWLPRKAPVSFTLRRGSNLLIARYTILGFQPEPIHLSTVTLNIGGNARAT